MCKIIGIHCCGYYIVNCQIIIGISFQMDIIFLKIWISCDILAPFTFCCQVPQQENDYDCGLFVLFYMQRFIDEAPKRLQKKDLSMVSHNFITVSLCLLIPLEPLPMDA